MPQDKGTRSDRDLGARSEPETPEHHRAGEALARATGDFVAPWRRSPTPVALLWPFWSSLIVLSAAILICVGLTLDPMVARAAATLDPRVIGFFQIITQMGKSNWLFALSVMALLLAFYGRGRSGQLRERAAWCVVAARAFYLLAVLSFSGIASQLIKHLVGRARPRLIDAVGPYHFDLFSLRSVLASFPSGHTTTVFAIFGALTLLSPRFGPAFLLLALPVAASRIIVGAHYPSDVGGGIVLGLASALLVARLFARRRIAFTLAPDALAPKARGGAVLARALRRPGQ